MITLQEYIKTELVGKKILTLEALQDDICLTLSDDIISYVWETLRDEVIENACWSDTFNDTDRSIATYLFDIIEGEQVIDKKQAMRELVEDAITREADEIEDETEE